MYILMAGAKGSPRPSINKPLNYWVKTHGFILVNDEPIVCPLLVTLTSRDIWCTMLYTFHMDGEAAWLVVTMLINPICFQGIEKTYLEVLLIIMYM